MRKPVLRDVLHGKPEEELADLLRVSAGPIVFIPAVGEAGKVGLKGSAGVTTDVRARYPPAPLYPGEG